VFGQSSTDCYCRRGDELKELVDISRESTTTVILDEVGLYLSNETSLIFLAKFYSWYIYHDDEKDIGKPISSAEYVEDVNSDSVVIVDGLTKVLPISFDRKFATHYSGRTGDSLGGGFAGFWAPRISSLRYLSLVCCFGRLRRSS
jgi:hypothetical protein